MSAVGSHSNKCISLRASDGHVCSTQTEKYTRPHASEPAAANTQTCDFPPRIPFSQPTSQDSLRSMHDADHFDMTVSQR